MGQLEIYIFLMFQKEVSVPTRAAEFFNYVNVKLPRLTSRNIQDDCYQNTTLKQ